MTIQLNSDNFQKEVLDDPGVVLVDFWAPWCGPCRMVAPILEEIAGEYENKVKVGKVNTDENMMLQAKYNIMSIPTMMIFKKGELVDQIIGAVPKQIIKQKLDQWLA